MKILIVFGIAFLLVNDAKALCHDDCMTSKTKSCEDSCTASCSTAGNNMETSTAPQEPSSTDLPMDQSTPTSQPTFLRKVRDLPFRPGMSNGMAPIPQQTGALKDNIDQQNNGNQLPIRPNAIRGSLTSRDDPINVQEPYRPDAALSRDRNSRHVPNRFVRDTGDVLPERPNRVIFGLPGGDVQLPFRKDALRSRDSPIPVSNDNIAPNRFIRDTGDVLPERPNRVIFGLPGGDVQLPFRKNALRSRDSPIPVSNDNNGNQPWSSSQNPPPANQTDQSQCVPRCNSDCLTQAQAVCQQTCNNQN